MQEWFSSAIVLIALFSAFIALVIWAWSNKRHTTFDAASQLPLREDEIPSQDSNKQASGNYQD